MKIKTSFAPVVISMLQYDHSSTKWVLKKNFKEKTNWQQCFSRLLPIDRSPRNWCFNVKNIKNANVASKNQSETRTSCYKLSTKLHIVRAYFYPSLLQSVKIECFIICVTSKLYYMPDLYPIRIWINNYKFILWYANIYFHRWLYVKLKLTQNIGVIILCGCRYLRS